MSFVCKMFDVFLCDGRIYDCFGPYPSNPNYSDQFIWDDICENNKQNIKNVFDTGHYIVWV